MSRFVLAVFLLSATILAGCGIIAHDDPRGPIITLPSGDYDTLGVGAKDTIDFSAWTPRTPETVATISRAGRVTPTIMRNGNSSDTTFAGSLYLTAGAVAGPDTVEIRLFYQGGEDGVKDVYVTVK